MAKPSILVTENIEAVALVDAFDYEVSVWMIFFTIQLMAQIAKMILRVVCLLVNAEETEHEDELSALAAQMGIPLGHLQKTGATIKNYYDILMGFVNDVLLFVFTLGVSVIIAQYIY